MNGDPRCAARSIDERVQQRPVGDRVGAVFHRFSFAVRGSNRTTIQMIAPDYDGRLQLAPGHQLVQRQPEFVALAVAEPADTRWQSLELHFFLSHGDPALQMLILGEHLEYQLIGACDVGNLTGKRGPAKRASSFAEE